MSMYYAREKSLHDQANMIYSAEQRKALEIAKSLLDVLDDETISIKTGISVEQIKAFRLEES